MLFISCLQCLTEFDIRVGRVICQIAPVTFSNECGINHSGTLEKMAFHRPTHTHKNWYSAWWWIDKVPFNCLTLFVCLTLFHFICRNIFCLFFRLYRRHWAVAFGAQCHDSLQGDADEIHKINWCVVLPFRSIIVYWKEAYCFRIKWKGFCL